MKMKLILLLAIAFAISFLLSSCRKEIEISEDDVVESIEAALKSNGAEDMALISSPYKSAACGFTNDTTVTKSMSGLDFNWSRTANWNWVVNCDSNNAYNNVVFTESGTSNFDGPRIEWTATHGGAFTVNNLSVSEANFIVNGNMTRNASGIISARRRNANYTSTIVHNWTDINVNKDSRSIVSGTGSVSYSGTIGGNTIIRTGTIVYNGNGTATLTMDNGNIFTIQTR